MFARAVIDSPVGPLFLETSDRGLRRLAFGSGHKFPEQISDSGPPTPAAEEMLGRAVALLEDYFSGQCQEFDLPLDIEGTSFQKRVWHAIAAIPYASTISYARLAAAAGSPGAFRAAGAACGANPVAIVVPCHRVVGSDRSLHGFGGGLPAKRWLLDHEASTAMANGARQAVLTHHQPVLV